MPSSGEKLELSFSATKLKKKDVLSQSDPILILSVAENESGESKELGRTEVIKDSANPTWLTKFIFNYRFEARQMLILNVYDWDKGDSKTTPPNKKDLIGSANLSIGQLMAAGGKGTYDLGKKNGTVTVAAEPVKVSNEALCLTYSATDLDKKDVFGKSDPFLVFSRQNPDGSFSVVHKSEVIKNSLNPVWAPMVLPVTLLCGGDESRGLKIECFDSDSNGKHDLIGECVTSVSHLRAGPGDLNTHALINPKKVGKKKYVNSGTLKMMSQGSREELSFLHHIRKGAQINFTLGIDFSTHNGDFKDSRSLHFLKKGEDNEYLSAIKSIGEVLQDYDTDGYFPSLGFGGKLNDGRLSQGFYMNGSADNPNCHGLVGLIKAYYNSVHSITPSSPCCLSPIINHVARIAASSSGNQYFVIVLLSTGQVSDLEATKRALVEASGLPLSVVVVGIGSGDFDALKMLDGDKQRLSFEGKVAQRDIVQFVRIRSFLTEGGEGMKGALAAAVLEELPSQYLSWRRSKGE